MRSTTSIDTAVRPWADLLPELCGLVMDRLDAFSVLRFPAVCKSWHAAACEGTPPRLRLRSGAPTLLLTPDRDTLVLHLHDVSTGKSFHVEADGGLKKNRRRWIGGKHDWLVTTDARCGVELLNPATGGRVPLPSFATIPRASIMDDAPVLLRVAPRSVHRLQQVALCRTPAHRNGYFAIAMFGGLLAFTAAGDDSWTALTNQPKECITYEDAIVHGRRIFAVTENGRVYCWDMADGGARDPAAVHLAPEMIPTVRLLRRRFNLAVSRGSGRFLQVCTYEDWFRSKIARELLHADEQLSRITTPRVLLHELDDTGGSGGMWRRVSDLGGDLALFVGQSYPFYAAVPRGCGDLKPNNVYAADVHGHSVIVFDVCTGGFEPLVHPGVGGSLRRPIWFRPTAHLEAKGKCM